MFPFKIYHLLNIRSIKLNVKCLCNFMQVTGFSTTDSGFVVQIKYSSLTLYSPDFPHWQIKLCGIRQSKILKVTNRL